MSIFNLKGKMSYLSTVAYDGKCNYCENYIGET